MSEKGELQIPPIAKIIGAGAAAFALWFTLQSCEIEAIQDPVGIEAVDPSTSTTEAEPEPPYYNQFGWDADYAFELTRDYLSESLATSPINIAAGRCIVTLVTNQEEEEFRIIKNPLIFEGEYNGVRFTTFSGIEYHTLSEEEKYSVLISSVSIIEGEVFFGTFGTVPNGTKYIDELGVVKRDYLSTNSDLNYNSSATELGYVPGEIVKIPVSNAAEIAEHCSIPGYEDPISPT